MRQLVVSGFVMIMISTSAIAATTSPPQKIKDSFVIKETCSLNVFEQTVDDNSHYGDAEYRLEVASNIAIVKQKLEFSAVTAPQIDQPIIYKTGQRNNSLEGKIISVSAPINVKFGGSIKKGINSGSYEASVQVTAHCQP
ncbi:hypothetical protein [Vibrio caribbeanicus]|uniref:hypothetical protein n=1 Tax=Vibrio caribbeanicus TaxID=701175 RepID=UPI002283BC94|nr:hypothetical protein [Vibrio caribbeanicus]MCY9844914.1 hypothetical protein [Vibrio caribbeanicus]